MENQLINGMLGLLLTAITAIGVLVYARLGFMLGQIREINKIIKEEAAARELRWQTQFKECSDERALLSRLIGVLEGKGVLPSGWGERYNPKK